MKNIFLVKIILVATVLTFSFQSRAEILETKDTSIIKSKISKLQTGDMG